MAVTINIVGDLILDQSSGIQDDDVNVTNTGNVLGGALDDDFEQFLNGLNLSTQQKMYAAKVEGAKQENLVQVTADAGETVKSLFFSQADGSDFTGQLSPNTTLLDGSPLYLWSINGGKEVILTTSSADATSGFIAAAFYIESNDSTNLAAKVEMITFASLLHTDTNDADDRVVMSDILQVSAAVVVTTPVGDDVGVDDDGPTIETSDTGVMLTVDETLLGTNDSKSFAAEFISDGGTDEPADPVEYSLTTVGGDSGLVDTATGLAVNLFDNNGVIEGRITGDIVVFAVSVDSSGNVTLDQQRAIVHPTLDPDENKTLLADGLISLHASITDADGDSQSTFINIGQNLNFEDDGPSISTTGTPPSIALDETTIGFATGNFGPNFSKVAGADGQASLTFALNVTALTLGGTTNSLTGENVSLSKNAITGNIEAKTAIGGLLVFTIAVDAAGEVTFTQARAITHTDTGSVDETRVLGAPDLVTLTGTITDGDGDKASATLNIGDLLSIDDDGPTITQTFDADGVPGNPVSLIETIANTVNAQATGAFGYSLGADDHNAAFYVAGGSDFVDQTAQAGNNMTLTGQVDNGQNPGITQAVVTLTGENSTSASFTWSYHYDKDPITVGVQDATVAGTLAINKATDTYTYTLTDVAEGFSFSVLHSNELLQKAPPGNTGHPELVVTELDAATQAGGGHDGFYVQFTANSINQANPAFGFNATGDGNPIVGDTTFNNGQFITSTFEDWVSATQTTNGVAGDTIQKGEELTLRFFGENILGDVNPNAPGGGTEKVEPTKTTDAVAIKFDGIGASEDLVVLLDLKDANGNETTRAINVQNSDLFKLSNGGVPFPYSTEFTLDNNDALLIIEQNDYNADGETFAIQGMQIMQSANGLSGNAINLNGAVGASGFSSTTTGLTAWDTTDNDVLKIVDIGFIETTAGQTSADLDFAFQLVDADGDKTAIQHFDLHI